MDVKYCSQPTYSPCWQNKKKSHGILKDDFYFSIELDSQIYAMSIPKGFIWDGNSIPKVFWFFTGTPWAMDLLVAGLVHDWLYRTGKIDRKRSDKIHYLLARSGGVSWLRAQKMHKALRAFGWIAWKNNRKKEDKNK